MDEKSCILFCPSQASAKGAFYMIWAIMFANQLDGAKMQNEFIERIILDGIDDAFEWLDAVEASRRVTFRFLINID